MVNFSGGRTRGFGFLQQWNCGENVYHLVFQNWEEEWEKIVDMASPVASSNGLQFDSLEDIHIFVLSNILRRPIIVIAGMLIISREFGAHISIFVNLPLTPALAQLVHSNCKVFFSFFPPPCIHRSSAEEYEVWLLFFTPQCRRHLPSSSLASRRVLQVSHSARLWLSTLCPPNHNQRQRPRYSPDLVNLIVTAFNFLSFVIYVCIFFLIISCSLSEFRALPLINPGRGGFEELRVHFLTEKEQQQKERLLNEYLMLMEIPVIGMGYDPTQIIRAARYVPAPVTLLDL